MKNSCHEWCYTKHESTCGLPFKSSGKRMNIGQCANQPMFLIFLELFWHKIIQAQILLKSPQHQKKTDRCWKCTSTLYKCRHLLMDSARYRTQPCSPPVGVQSSDPSIGPGAELYWSILLPMKIFVGTCDMRREARVGLLRFLDATTRAKLLSLKAPCHQLHRKASGRPRRRPQCRTDN